MRRVGAVAALLVLCGALAPGLSYGAQARTSLTAVEADLMCTSCGEPLAVAQSPQAYAERAYIRQLIGQGLDKRQIDQAMVAQYGPAVLARPPAHGFDLTVYVLPALVVVLGLATLAVVLPRWRRAARLSRRGPVAAAPAISPGEAGRLEEDLSRFDG